jgi:hypothetical protein
MSLPPRDVPTLPLDPEETTFEADAGPQVWRHNEAMARYRRTFSITICPSMTMSCSPLSSSEWSDLPAKDFRLVTAAESELEWFPKSLEPTQALSFG